MPSAHDLYRLSKLMNEMNIQDRNQFIANTITILEVDERDRCVNPTESSELAAFGNALKAAMQSSRLEVGWFHQLFKDNKNNPYFVRFLKRVLQK